jgi:glycosyltransferase involved in cell wall biosynthesis
MYTNGDMMQEKITYVGITQNRIKNLKMNIPKLIDYVDRAVIVDGYSVDGTKEWLESFSPKIFVPQRKWDDNFGAQHGEYLKHVGEGWCLLCDDDEVPSEELLKNMRQVIDESDEGRKYCVVEYRCNSIDVDKNGKILRDSGPENYRKQLLFKYMPNMYYFVNLHQCLVGHKNGRHLKRHEVYYHIKTEEDSYRGACRNWWVAGVWLGGATEGILVKEWYELKDVVKKAYPHVNVFNDFNDIMIKGNIDQSVKDYICKVKDIQDEPPERILNELRAYWKYYFDILHPEEK